MAQLIDLTVTRRKSANKDDSFSTPLTYGFDVEDIVVPVRNDGSDSYFTARQLKGTHPSSKSVGSTNYWVSESLTAIAAKSDLLVELTVTKRRSVDVASEKYVFVTSRFSESIKVSDTGGSKFFYQEDGDANLVEYEVSETIAQIVSQSVLPLGGFIELTYAQAAAEAAACTLVEGAHYKITDRADLGITLLAVTSCEFSLEGQGIFLNPDFQDIGALSGSMDGVWYAGGEAGYTNSEVVIWDGLHYQVIEDTAFDGTNPATNSLLPVPAYIVLPKTILNGYIEEVDFILYDFAGDEILRRIDKRNNDINSFLDVFQWGNDSVFQNKVYSDGQLRCINQRGTVNRLDVSKQATVTASETHESSLVNCVFKARAIYNCSMITGEMISCEVEAPVDNILINYTFDPDTFHVLKQLNSSGSNFEAELDMTDGDDYNAATDTLTIPTDLNYVGIFNLVDCAAQPILKIVNLPSVGEVEFRVADAADTVVFTNTAIGGAVANNLVADVAGNNTLVGRIDGNDFIRYRKSGNLNVRTTGSIMA